MKFDESVSLAEVHLCLAKSCFVIVQDHDLTGQTYNFLREIQQTLVEIGDKDPSFIGSREWIGAIELSFVLDKLLGVSIAHLRIS